jgi:hypothetical protein
MRPMGNDMVSDSYIFATKNHVSGMRKATIRSARLDFQLAAVL